MDLLAAADRQPRQLRHQHHRRRAARHHRRAEAADPQGRGRPGGADQVLHRASPPQEITLIKRLSRRRHAVATTTPSAWAPSARRPAPRASRATSARTTRTPPTASWPSRSSPTTTTTCTAGRWSACGELMESYKMIRQLIDEHARRARSPSRRRARSRPARPLSRYEAPRGEDVHYVRANGTEKPERVKVRAPTLANVQAVAHMLKDRYLADVPIVIAAIDPCFSCTDRLIAVRQAPTAGARRHDLGASCASYGIEWYRQQRHRFHRLEQDLPRGENRLMATGRNLFYMLVFPGLLFLIVFALAAEYVDRKLYARLQNRVGPPWFQPLADIIKLAAKEDLVPGRRRPPMFTLDADGRAGGRRHGLPLHPDVGPHGARSRFEGDVIVVLYLLTIPTLTFFLGGWYSRSRLLHDRRGPLDHAALRLRDSAVPEHPGAGPAGRHLVAQRDDASSTRDHPLLRAVQRRRLLASPWWPCWASWSGCRSTSPRPRPRSSPAASPSTAAGCWPCSAWPSTSRWWSARRCWRPCSCRSAWTCGPVVGFVLYLVKVLLDRLPAVAVCGP